MAETYEKSLKAALVQVDYILDNYEDQPLVDLDEWLREEVDKLVGHLGDSKSGADAAITERDERIETLEHAGSREALLGLVVKWRGRAAKTAHNKAGALNGCANDLEKELK